MPPGELTPNYRADNNPVQKVEGGRERGERIRVGGDIVGGSVVDSGRGTVCSRRKSECAIARVPRPGFRGGLALSRIISSREH